MFNPAWNCWPLYCSKLVTEFFSNLQLYGDSVICYRIIILLLIMWHCYDVVLLETHDIITWSLLSSAKKYSKTHGHLQLYMFLIFPGGDTSALDHFRPLLGVRLLLGELWEGRGEEFAIIVSSKYLNPALCLLFMFLHQWPLLHRRRHQHHHLFYNLFKIK